MNRLLAVSIALVAMTGTTGGAAEGQLSGVVFGDAYWFAANHDSAAEDANGLWVRRVYLTYDVKQTENVSMRLRFESGSPGLNSEADTAILARVDIAIDENPRAAGISYLPLDGSSRFFFILVGLDYSPEAGFSLMPNIEVVSYADSGIDADVVPRLTFSYTF